MKFRHTLVAFLLMAVVSPALAQTDGAIANEGDAPRYEIDYTDVSLEEFIDSVGRITGKHFIVDPRVRGNISLQSQRSLSADELYRVFLNRLQINGYATVELGHDQVRIVPDQVARTQPLPLGNETDSGNVMATQVIESQHLDASTLANILQPLVDARVGTITPYPDSNMVVVTDWRDNLQRLTRLATLLDSNRDTGAEVVSLDFADAQELAETIDSALQGSGGDTRVIASPRANALVVFGSQRDRQRAQRLVAALDKPSEHQNSNTRVIYLNHAGADTVVEVLRSLRDGGGHVSTIEAPGAEVRQVLGTPVGQRERLAGRESHDTGRWGHRRPHPAHRLKRRRRLCGASLDQRAGTHRPVFTTGRLSEHHRTARHTTCPGRRRSDHRRNHRVAGARARRAVAVRRY